MRFHPQEMFVRKSRPRSGALAIALGSLLAVPAAGFFGCASSPPVAISPPPASASVSQPPLMTSAPQMALAPAPLPNPTPAGAEALSGRAALPVVPCAAEAPIGAGANQANPAVLNLVQPTADSAQRLPPPPPPLQPAPRQGMPINLPTALRLANSSNPTIALASARVEEAYRRVDQVDVSWLPNLRAGPTYNRQDGRNQSSHGDVFSVSKSNFYLHGDVVASWSTSDLLFSPLIARQAASSQSAAARAAVNNVQLNVALVYEDLLRVHGQLAVNADVRRRAAELFRNAKSANEAGLGKTPADVTQAATEANRREQERFDLEGEAGTLSAQLAALLLLEPTIDLVPAETTIVPLRLVPANYSIQEMVATGWGRRPEMRQAQDLIAAAQTRLKQSATAPLLPHLDVAYAGGMFGAGVGDEIGDFGARSIGMAQVTWELKNFGAGDVAATRVQRSVVAEASANLTIVRAQIGSEIASAAKTAQARLESLNSAQESVRQAIETWRRSSAASFGLAGGDRRYDPLEPLIAVRDIADARVRYLTAVIEYNKAELRLFWAMGQPVECALEGPSMPQPAAASAFPLPEEIPHGPATTQPAPVEPRSSK